MRYSSVSSYKPTRGGDGGGLGDWLGEERGEYIGEGSISSSSPSPAGGDGGANECVPGGEGSMFWES